MMQHRNILRRARAAGSAALASTAAVAAGGTQVDRAAVDDALAALKTYDWGTDRKKLNPIDEAVIATRGDAAARRDLETRLIAELENNTSRSAKDFICRTLKTMGTSESVPALAKLLPDEDLSHMARFALERIPAPEAAAAMRDALPRLSDTLKVGAIGSLGVRRDAASVATLAGSLLDTDTSIASAAAHALGTIGNAEAGQALVEGAKKAAEDTKPAIADACLMCAERLLAQGEKSSALQLYKSLSGADQPRHVRLAARRGLLFAAKR
jgi:HEAT repeat protein